MAQRFVFSGGPEGASQPELAQLESQRGKGSMEDILLSGFTVLLTISTFLTAIRHLQNSKLSTGDASGVFVEYSMFLSSSAVSFFLLDVKAGLSLL